MLRFKVTKAASDASVFAERSQSIGTAAIGVQQCRNRVPTVAAQEAGSAVVAGDDRDGGIQFQHARDDGVEFFRPLHLGIEVSVFAGAVRVFEVDKEEVVFVPALLQDVHLLAERLSLADDVHADKSRQALVHRIDRDGSGLETVYLFVARQVRLGGEAAHRVEVSLLLVLQDPTSLNQELLCNFCCLLARFVFRDGIERWDAGRLRIGIADATAKPSASEDNDKAMFLHGLDEDLDPRNGNLPQLDRQWRTLFGRDSTGSSIRDIALRVQRTEVAADGHIARLQLEADSGRFQRTATDQIFNRIVAEQPEMAGPLPGLMPRATGILAP